MWRVVCHDILTYWINFLEATWSDVFWKQVQGIEVVVSCSYIHIKQMYQKCVHLLTSLGPVTVFIVLVVSLHLSRSPFSLYSRRVLLVWIEDVTISVYYWPKVDFMQRYQRRLLFSKPDGWVCCHFISIKSKYFVKKCHTKLDPMFVMDLL